MSALQCNWRVNNTFQLQISKLMWNCNIKSLYLFSHGIKDQRILSRLSMLQGCLVITQRQRRLFLFQQRPQWTRNFHSLLLHPLVLCLQETANGCKEQVHGVPLGGVGETAQGNKQTCLNTWWKLITIPQQRRKFPGMCCDHKTPKIELFGCRLSKRKLIWHGSLTL